MSWDDVENSVQRAFVAASGLPDGQVIWSYQNVDEQAEPHLIINFGGEIVLGIDRLEVSVDLTRPNGQEVKQEIKGVREVPLELQFFTTATTGESAARRLASLTVTKLRLPSVRYLFEKVNVSPFDPGPVQWVPDIPNAKFRGRAACTVRCYVPVTDCVEYVGYIARVVGVARAHGGGTATGWGPTGLSIPFDFAVG